MLNNHFINRLRLLAGFLVSKKYPEDFTFVFGEPYVNDNGNEMGGVAALLPKVFSDWEYSYSPMTNSRRPALYGGTQSILIDQMSQFFGVPNKVLFHLFSPGKTLTPLSKDHAILGLNADRFQVSDHIKHFCNLAEENSLLLKPYLK